MTAIDTTKAKMDAPGRSPFPSPTLKRNEIDVANTLRLRMYSNPTKPEGALRDASEGNDRQVLPARTIIDAQLDHDAGPSSNERVWSYLWNGRSGLQLKFLRAACSLAVNRSSISFELRNAWGAKPLEIQTWALWWTIRSPS